LIGAIVLGAASTAQGSAAEKTASQNGSGSRATALRLEPCSPTGDARPGSRSAHRWHKRLQKFHRTVSGNDPNDDGTSSDPDDDDDASDDLSCNEETHGPILACVHEVGLYWIAKKTASAPALTESHSHIFLALQRLRC
jgi:hypothetical protein